MFSRLKISELIRKVVNIVRGLLLWLLEVNKAIRSLSIVGTTDPRVEGNRLSRQGVAHLTLLKLHRHILLVKVNLLLHSSLRRSVLGHLDRIVSLIQFGVLSLVILDGRDELLALILASLPSLKAHHSGFVV